MRTFDSEAPFWLTPEQSTAWIEFGGVVHCMSVSDLATFKTAANCYSLFERGPVEYVSSKDPSFAEYVPFLPRFGKLTTLEQARREDLAEAFNRIARAMVEMETLNDEAHTTGRCDDSSTGGEGGRKSASFA